jgi:hypothetical protein
MPTDISASAAASAPSTPSNLDLAVIRALVAAGVMFSCPTTAPAKVVPDRPTPNPTPAASAAFSRRALKGRLASAIVVCLQAIPLTSWTSGDVNDSADVRQECVSSRHQSFGARTTLAARRRRRIVHGRPRFSTDHPD